MNSKETCMRQGGGLSTKKMKSKAIDRRNLALAVILLGVFLLRINVIMSTHHVGVSRDPPIARENNPAPDPSILAAEIEKDTAFGWVSHHGRSGKVQG